jgi:hypothetical protein
VSEPLTMSPRDRLQLWSGVLLCALVFLFSTSAKLATYHHDPADKQIAATKLVQKSVAPAPTVAPQVFLASLVWLAFLTLSVAAPRKIFIPAMSETAQPVNCWFSPYLAVRPPPAN